MTSAILDRIATEHGRRVLETPVGFKWFAEGFLNSAVAFAAEESAGASLLRLNGAPWTTDKDGIAMGLLAAEIVAVTGQSLSALYSRLEARHGRFEQERVELRLSPSRMKRLEAQVGEAVTQYGLLGESAEVTLVASGNRQAIGGIRIQTATSWITFRRSGTEAIYRIYAESNRGRDHLESIVDWALDFVHDNAQVTSPEH